MPPRVLALRTRPGYSQCLYSPRIYSTTTVHHQSSNTRRSTAPRPSATSAIDDYYALLLEQPLPVDATREEPSKAPPSSFSANSSPSKSTSGQTGGTSSKASTVEERARLVFGWQDTGPAAGVSVEKVRSEQKARGEGEWIGSTWVPPRPGEPDNCCMSGCVNCVWDGYREDLEGWAATRRTAFAALSKDKLRQQETGLGASMDDDGGGSEGLWNETGAKKEDEGGLFEGIPVGIREFMASEKRLAERKKARAA